MCKETNKVAAETMIQKLLDLTGVKAGKFYGQIKGEGNGVVGIKLTLAQVETLVSKLSD